MRNELEINRRQCPYLQQVWHTGVLECKVEEMAEYAVDDGEARLTIVEQRPLECAQRRNAFAQLQTSVKVADELVDLQDIGEDRGGQLHARYSVQRREIL